MEKQVDDSGQRLLVVAVAFMSNQRSHRLFSFLYLFVCLYTSVKSHNKGCKYSALQAELATTSNEMSPVYWWTTHEARKIRREL